MTCPNANSGQGMYRNGRRPPLHKANPISTRNNKKRKYHKASLAARRHELLELTKDWLELTAEEVELFLEEEWHDGDESGSDSFASDKPRGESDG